MLGCLRRVGCLVLVVAFVGGGYVTRHRWIPLIAPTGRDAIAELGWAPLTPEGARRARTVIGRLSRPDGPVFANLPAADLAAVLLDSLVSGLATGERPTEVAVQDDRFFLRTEVRIADLGPENIPLIGGVANRRAVLVLGGRLRVERPGLGEWVIDEFIIDAVTIPGPAVPRLTRALAQHLRRAGTHDDALGFALPEVIGDLRVRPSGITLYKTVLE